MKLPIAGEDTSQVEVLNISRHGFWLYLQGEEHFLPFDHFPWFKEASISALLKVELLHDHHLYWPDLDVDLELDSIREPEKYPLVYRSQG